MIPTWLLRLRDRLQGKRDRDMSARIMLHLQEHLSSLDAIGVDLRSPHYRAVVQALALVRRLQEWKTYERPVGSPTGRLRKSEPEIQNAPSGTGRAGK